MRVYILLFLLVFSFSMVTKAQDRYLHGVVHALDSIPLEGVQIKVKSSGQIYKTTATGEFVIECNANDKLTILADGFYKRNVKLPDNLKFVAINLKMKPGYENTQHLIGYKNIDESERTGAISGISYKDTDFTKYHSVEDIIRDNIAGIQVTSDGIVIRGARTLIGSSTPLVVIDGIISDSDLSYLNPLDIKWIGIIKDGTAAIYGSRGANGVILIETKKGGEL